MIHTQDPQSKIYRPPDQARRPSPDRVVGSREIQIERKTFVFERRQNPHGSFIAIVETIGGKRNRIAVPSSGLRAFREALDEAIAAEGNQ